MSIANTFPVFEADQVLTNKHLNDLFNYLDEQNRLTRCKLLGSGIVCGLDISFSNDTISITKGCGLTSQGFIILFCDHLGDNAYKYFVPYTRPSFPSDLQLIVQCGNEPDHTNILFYNNGKQSSENDPDGNIFLLLTQTDYDNLSDNSTAVALSQSDLSQFAVVIFLEADELSLKNCDTNDCNDKGSLMDFEIRPLLVNKKLLAAGGNNTGKPFQQVELRRYNVPVKNLTTADDVLNAFVALLDPQTLGNLSNDLRSCFDQYSYLLPGGNNTTNPFGLLADFQKDIKAIMQSRPYLIQYYYDFIYDLISAFYEFRYKAYSISGECCGDEMKFPFHLVLGEASADAASSGSSAYRQTFIYSPLFDVQGGKADELRSLLMRMILMYQDFMPGIRAQRKNILSLPEQVKITPSSYGRVLLSEKCIPYYYKTVHDSNDLLPMDLYFYWSYDKTKRGNARFNLTYDPTPYNTANTVISPLSYDIEWYNFYRVEGHIGKNINTALSDVISIKQNFNLPFDVVALSADYIGALVAGNDPVCCIQDLESDYRIVIAEFICELHTVFCYSAKLPFTPPVQVLAEELIPLKTSARSTKGTSAKTTAAGISADALASKAFVNVTGVTIDHPFISSLVNEFQATASYTKGDTLSRLCSVAADATGKTLTIGNYYIASVKANKGSFVNPISSSVTMEPDALNHDLFEFIDSVETMFQMLMTTDLSAFDSAVFKPLYKNYEAAVNSANGKARILIEGLSDSGKINIEYLYTIYIENVQVIMQTCIVEKLEALKNEYLRRLAQYRLAKNFNYYFRKHGGIEHKAGVPRGGTFILVYHEERKNRLVDVRSLFINKQLNNALLSNFRELLQPDVSLDTQEAKTKMLAVSLLYKDPTLYMTFKNVMQQYLDDCTDLPPDKKTQLTGIINQPPDKQTFTLPDGMVIADFYIPYMCCSDCPPIAYILPPAPDPLSVSQSDPVCDQEGQNFTVVLTVTGGTLPYSYSVNNAAVADNNITLPSGTPVTNVLITDAAGRTATTTIKTHSCCDLPCGGNAEKASYVLWIQRPGLEAKISKPQLGTPNVISILDTNGSSLFQQDLAPVFQQIFKADTIITNANYDEVFLKIADALNTVVPKQFIGNNQPMFSYDKANGLLNIESFSCQQVQLTIPSFSYTFDDRRIEIFAVYNSGGVTLKTPEGLIFNVPKLAPVEMNKCAGTTKVVCQEVIKIEEITANQEEYNTNSFTFSIKEKFDKYFWYMQGCVPMYSTEASPQHAQIQNSKILFTKVIGIKSPDNCFGLIEKTPQVNDIIG